MVKFVIAPHMRLHEWVARDKGYFDLEGLQYEFRDQLSSTPTGRIHDLGDKIGAYQTFERGRDSNISCACHWTVNVAASVGHGKFYPDAYSVAPAAVFVPPESDIKRWGPGERLVFEPYTKEVYEESFAWIAAHGIFPDGEMGAGRYEDAILAA